MGVHSKKKKRSLKRRIQLVKQLIEMLKVKDFTYFNKDTLTQIALSSESDQTLFVAFHIVRLLRKFYSLDECSNVSYEEVLYKKMSELKHLLPVDIQLSVRESSEMIKQVVGEDTFNESA